MKTTQKFNLDTLPVEKTEESWEEVVFWKIDMLLSKVWPYILLFSLLYIAAHIIYSKISGLM